MTQSGRTLRPALPGVSASAGESGVCTPDTPVGRHGVRPEYPTTGHYADRVSRCHYYEGNRQQKMLLTRTSKSKPPSTQLGQDQEGRGRGGYTSIHGSRPHVGEDPTAAGEEWKPAARLDSGLAERPGGDSGRGGAVVEVVGVGGEWG